METSLRYYDAQTVIAKCSADHGNMPARIVEISRGYGRHVHTAGCGYVEGDPISCMRNADDSDLIIELRYVCEDGAGCYVTDTNGHEHGAVYGMLDGKFSLWLD